MARKREKPVGGKPSDAASRDYRELADALGLPPTFPTGGGYMAVDRELLRAYARRDPKLSDDERAMVVSLAETDRFWRAALGEEYAALERGEEEVRGPDYRR